MTNRSEWIRACGKATEELVRQSQLFRAMINATAGITCLRSLPRRVDWPFVKTSNGWSSMPVLRVWQPRDAWRNYDPAKELACWTPYEWGKALPAAIPDSLSIYPTNGTWKAMILPVNKNFWASTGMPSRIWVHWSKAITLIAVGLLPVSTRVRSANGGLKYLSGYEKLLKEFGYPYKRLEREDLRPIFGTSHYAAAIYTADTATGLIPSTMTISPAAPPFARAIGTRFWRAIPHWNMCLSIPPGAVPVGYPATTHPSLAKWAIMPGCQGFIRVSVPHGEPSPAS